ncbi:unnamed protein product [Anisakis simplex]|uniref:EGF-like domain-containing protein n=1 Tax=Anisakis simplex TaxID=6269 RepID=A0A0M3K298_ANISI|nr:unnamed protein product [Anisakis simplex]
MWLSFALEVLLTVTYAVNCNMQVLSSSNIPSQPIFFGPEVVVNITCLNGGSIIDGKCHCQPRFEGTQCELEPCLNGGMRSKSPSANGRCHCPYGLTGDRCERVTHCVEGKGKLVDGKCKCSDRWSGLFCQLRTCYNGVSVGSDAGTFCLCDIGYKGPFCDIPIVCIHGAISSENVCVCEPNWVGESCDRCAIVIHSDHRLEDNECHLIVNDEEALMVIKNPDGHEYWTIVVIGGCVAFIVVLIAISSVVVIKRYHSKASRVGLTAATDV